MTEAGGDRDIAARQKIAISTQHNAGSFIHSENRNRKQEVVPVTTDDLEEIRSFGSLAMFFFSIGMFFFSGASWLLFEELAVNKPKELNILIVGCSLSIFCGIVFVVSGLIVGSFRRGKIDRILAQVE